MSIRRLFIFVIVAFAVLVSAVGGYLAWQEASQAVEAELDEKAVWVAGAAAAAGLQSSLLDALQPGFEDELAWTSTHNRLRRLDPYVPEAYVIRDDNTAVVSSHPADSVPIGTPLRFLDPFLVELQSARMEGSATTPAFADSEGRLYKWGFARLEESDLVLAVLMPADYLSPLARLRQNLLLGSAVAAALAALLAGLLAAGIIEPVERLSRVASRIQHGRWGEPVAPERGEELGRLSRAMERMRLGIVERDEQLRLMLAQVAHEIRNPLGGLELFAAAATDTEDPVERRRLMDRVRSEVAALNGIIDDFLAFARPVEAPREVTDLRVPLREAADLVRAELEDGGGQLEVSLSDAPLMARVDPSHAKRAALNLLRNAAQVADHVRLEGWSEGTRVVVAVSDDGPGVPEELKERIFDPFVTDKEQGAGLGLAIVRKVAEAYGGEVELMPAGETNGGRGSEFRIYFGDPERDPSSPHR